MTLVSLLLAVVAAAGAPSSIHLNDNTKTADFEIDAARPRNLWLEVRRGNGEWVLQAPVQVR